MQKYIIPLLILTILGAACQNKTTTTTTNTSSQTNINQAGMNTNTTTSTGLVRWQFDGQRWSAAGTPPSCPDPIVMAAPVEFNLVTHVLYPGQTRGNDYKPHGGFRFDGRANNAVAVTVPLDAYVVGGARYIEQGETQYLFDFQNSCGLQYRFDHLLTLSPAFQALADQLPAAKPDDSRTTNFANPMNVVVGDQIATAVGFASTNNVSLDFGTYDLRTPNVKASDSAWAAAYAPEASQAFFATCWFDYFSSVDETLVRGKPAGDGTAGKTSDFCQ